MALQANTSVLQATLFGVSSVFAWFATIGNFAFNIFLYCTLVYVLVSAEKGPLEYALGWVPESGNLRGGLHDMLTAKIDAVFSAQLEGALFQAAFTWLIFDFARVPYVYLYCVLAAFFKTVPFISTSIVGVVGASHLYLTSSYEQQHAFLLSIALLLAYLYVDGRLATDIFQKKLSAEDATLLGMSVFLGLYAFGLSGIIYGPLLVTMANTIYEIVAHLEMDEQNNLIF